MYFLFKSEDISKCPAAQLGEGGRSQHFKKAQKRTSLWRNICPPIHSTRQIWTKYDTNLNAKHRLKRRKKGLLWRILSPSTLSPGQIWTRYELKYDPNLNTKYELKRRRKGLLWRILSPPGHSHRQILTKYEERMWRKKHEHKIWERLLWRILSPPGHSLTVPDKSEQNPNTKYDTNLNAKYRRRRKLFLWRILRQPNHTPRQIWTKYEHKSECKIWIKKAEKRISLTNF